ncbi:CLUMA_CG012500, isoform A [Clunio marinus]|uniref:CLUMA_CG012500, isoform A n=1 Tax=Clunio marinus TaxID=568069 RepID=A0A1J1IHE1_9DIPT|nr:CLUMA_CG012500, isoform A [Clunio marinus]
MKKSKEKILKRHKKRSIEDAPFYKFEYKPEDLPLDPARPFILEQINKIKQSKSDEFFHDFDLYIPPHGNGQPSSINIQLPDVFQSTDRDIDSKIGFTKSSRNNGWIQGNLSNSEKRVYQITKYFISTYKNRRVQVFHNIARTKAALRSKEFFRIYTSPSESIISKRSKQVSKIKASLKKSKNPYGYQFDHEKLRGFEESKEELAKVQAHIDKMIAKNLKRLQEEKLKKEATMKKVERHYPTLRELLLKPREEPPKAKKRKQPISNVEFLKRLKSKDRQQSKYLEALLPCHPDEQKLKILQKYNKSYKIACQLFTENMSQRMHNLFDEIIINEIETFPSKLFKKIFPRIDGKNPIWIRASKFIIEEQKLWPNVKYEMIFMDFLFNPENKIRREEAVMIICLLLDLQEDFRYNIKRGFMRYILQSEVERKRFELESEPPKFPMIALKAPVPWKCAVQIAKNRLEEVLMVNHPVLQAIQMVWYNLYNDLLIVDTAKFYKNEVPYHAENITKIINSCCKITRDILVNDWMPRIADLIEAMQCYWRDLVPRNSIHEGRARILFNCVHALLSLHLQGLIKRSLDHLEETIEVYNCGNLSNIYDPQSSMLKRRPLMTLIVSVVGKHEENDVKDKPLEDDSTFYQTNENESNLLPTEKPTAEENSESFNLENSGKMIVEPFVEELPDLFKSYFVKILKVGYEIPRLEYYMTQKKEHLGFLHYISQDHVDMLKLYEKVKKIVKANQNGPTTYLYPTYRFYFPILSGRMRSITESIFSLREIPSLQIFKELMEKFNQLLHGIYYLRDFIPLNLFMLDNRIVNRVLEKLVRELINFVTNYFVTLNQVENRRMCDEFEEMSINSGERPKETPEVVALQNYLVVCREDKLFRLKSEIQIVKERVMFLLTYASLTQEDINLNSRLFLWPSELEKVLDLSAARLSVVRDNLETALKDKRANFEQNLIIEKKKMDSFRLRDVRDVLSIDDLKEKVATVDGLMEILDKCTKEAKSINVDENLLQIDQSFFPILDEMIEKMEPVDKLWHTAYHFESCYEVWYYGKYVGLNSDNIRDEVDEMSKTIYKLTKALASNPFAKRIAEQIRLKIDKFRVYIPILESICRQGLVDRHWEAISQELGENVNPTLFPTLSTMVDLDIVRIQDKLEEISNAAGKEFELNLQLINMQEEWKDMKFDVTRYRDSDLYILASLDDVQALLDDHILKAQAMRGSPYIVALGKKAEDWEQKLITMQDILDVWLRVQSTWMYLEPIFGSEDILRQMPTEGRNFKKVDRIFAKIMAHTVSDPHVIQTTDFPDMLPQLRTSFEELEGIQKGLNMYLEKKRLFFARFFFLSNDELLEILAETKDPLRVQPHLKKCFEGISALNFDNNGEIIAIVSAEGEIVQITRKINPANANGLVEKWLKDVETIMIESVKEQIFKASETYFHEIRSEWVLKWPGQVVSCVSCMSWTQEVEESIAQNTLETFQHKCSDQILDLVDLVRKKLSPGAQLTIEALIVLDVHARDIVSLLVNNNVTSIDEFNWISQMRYYWRSNPEKQGYVSVCMVTTEVEYGMEYLGNTSRLVITPLTDRCFRTLMGALKLNLGGAPEGPAGTGKTETCKDLAKAVAKKCVVFNCSDGLDYKALGKFFKGLAQSGSWACFDEFNRIELEVLSVVAQQILTIQKAVQNNVVKFLFEDTTLKLDPTCNIFITMNPGYAGRTELPDNLKVLFRTCAMMVPDYAMIGEITLYSNGFDDARALAHKIVHTYKLCSEQLSSQHHYDYGMRAVKSVLLASAALRKNNPDMPEAKILLRAIIDVNLPKFLQQDIPLFEGIYKDLFPGVDIPEPARDDIKRHMEIIIKKKRLQGTSWFMEKVLQIYEMLLVRHGLMIVGDSMGGKTTAYQILAEVLKEVKNDSEAKVTEYPVNFRVINPKAISMGQLYGNFDPVTHEWYDGVIATTFREMVYSNTSDRQWIIFDGPVDAVWIENLNTVLDDNKKLCLMSGEIIQMTNKMNLVFEPADLEQASPATVSRCGMIYFEPSQLGWEALHKTFIMQLQDKGVAEVYLTLYDNLVEWLVPITLETLKSCQAVVMVSPMQMYHVMTDFFMSFLNKHHNYNQIWFQQIFLFCFAWAYGSTLTVEGRRNMEVTLRKILYGANENLPKPKTFSLNRGQMFPEKSNYMDYRFDENEAWWPWLKSEDCQFPPDAVVSDLMVPTKENGCIMYWAHHCISNSIPMLLIGPTGTGKSATILNFLKELPKDKCIVNTLNFSARTSAQQVQELIMSKLDRRRKGVFGPPVGKNCINFVDDIAMPARDKYGSQSPLELIRQWLDHGHWSDLTDTSNIELIDLLFIGAMGMPGGSNFIPKRLYRHMFCMAVDSFEDTTLMRIFGTLGEWHFAKGYSESISRLSKNLAASIIEVYSKAVQIYLPTPAKSHYTFSLRDVTRVYQGICMVPAKRLNDVEKLVRLWTHEIYRVFYDRLVETKDQERLLLIVESSCSNNLRIKMEQAFANRISSDEKINENHIRDLLFGNYMEPDADPKMYDEVESWSKLEKNMTYYLNEYNMLSNSPMDLVLFRFAIEHISRVSRLLQMPRGHVLLVGLGGSGRRSAVKLAASMSDAEIFQVEVTRAYGFLEWREDMKKLLLNAGLNSKPTVFLFSDSQAKDEIFIEDINSMLNTGDLPNLFPSEEKSAILEKMQVIAKASGKVLETTPLAMYGMFIDRVKESLHIALTFSPIGDSFKNRIRVYPSLMVMIFNTSVVSASKKYYLEQGRKNYVTPTSYLELLRSFNILYTKTFIDITMQRDRYTTGLEKLEFAAGQVAVMQKKLQDLQPQLKVTSDETEKIMVKIERDTAEAEKKKEVVGADEAAANEAAATSQAIRDDCEGDLAEAVPALESALSALDTLKPADITVVKSMKNPPSAIKLVLEAVCVLKGLKADRKPDANGRLVDDYWAASQKMLGDMKFLESLKTFDKDNISTPIMKKIRDVYISDRDFVPEKIKAVSTACEGLCRWIRAMDVYDRVIKIVGPKKIALSQAENDLAAQMEKLNSKKAELQEILDKLQTLNDGFAEKSREKKRLEDEIDSCEKKLVRAEQLIGGLGGEKQRWSESAANLHKSLGNVIGDVLLGAGCIAYLGYFSTEYRNNILYEWNKLCLSKKLPCTEKFSLANILGNPMDIRQNQLCGLPSDNFSTDNGIIVKNSRRWCLMIDPQGQANKWIKNLEKENDLKVIQQTDVKCMKTVEQAIIMGKPVLLENVGETIDSGFSSILERNVIKQKGKQLIKFGDSLIDYHDNFRFYITTCLRNPHYLPETAVLVTLVNFMITEHGLQEQLLATVVVQERPDLQQKKESLIVESAKNRNALYNAETSILQVLSSSEQNILEDENAINILTSSKALSESIQSKQVIAISTEIEIDTARQAYVPVAKHSAILFFCISELSTIDPMYQYSLSWFLNLFITSIIKAPQSDILQDRLDHLNAFFTRSIYENVCRSLFEKDKLVFSFSLCIGILIARGTMDEKFISFFLTDGVGLNNPHPNPASDWLTEKSWNEIVRASSLEELKNLHESVAQNIDKWKKFYELSNPEDENFPEPFNDVEDFFYLILLKAIRPDKIVPSVRKLIMKHMGHKFVDPPTFDLQASFNDSKPTIPLVFILSPGSDPMDTLMTFAKEHSMHEKCKSISLGQGQGPRAEKMIEESLRLGHWVILQNCHVAESWMNDLERLCTDPNIEVTAHKNYRLWITSYPSKLFPVAVLQNSVKMTNEAPKGLKLNLLRSFNSDPLVDETFFAPPSTSDDVIKFWYRGLFSLVYFHAVVQERRDFGPLGWNIPYEFNESDLKISLMQLKMFLKQYHEIPFFGHKYLTGECNYGGRVTDDNDRRLLMSLLDNFYNEDAVMVDNYQLSESGIYKIPLMPNRENCLEFISSLPSATNPEVFGLHENADITKNINETNNVRRFCLFYVEF